MRCMAPAPPAPRRVRPERRAAVTTLSPLSKAGPALIGFSRDQQKRSAQPGAGRPVLAPSQNEALARPETKWQFRHQRKI